MLLNVLIILLILALLGVPMALPANKDVVWWILAIILVLLVVK